MSWCCSDTKIALIEQKFQDCSYSNDDVTNYVNFLKNYTKNWLKYVGFFCKIDLATARKNIFKIFFQLLKLKITFKLNIYRLIS